MIVLLHSTSDFPDIQFLSPQWDGVRAYAVDNLQDFTSRLFRDPDAIGILYCRYADLAPQIVRGIRDGNVVSHLMVLLRERGDEDTRAIVRARTLVAGADDAQPDTIDPTELVARLRALHVRVRPTAGLIPIPPHGLFDPSNQQVKGGGIVIHLTGKESALLEALAERPGVCITKAHCMNVLYQGMDERGEKIVDVYLCKLRKKLRSICGDREPIQTIWGQGYRFIGDEVAV